jgi:hypothetical protein
MGEEVRDQGRAFDQLHGQEPLVAHAEQLVQRDQVRVHDARYRAELAPQRRRRPGAGVQALERDAGSARPIERRVHGAYSAAAQTALDGEAAELDGLSGPAEQPSLDLRLEQRGVQVETGFHRRTSSCAYRRRRPRRRERRPVDPRPRVATCRRARR